VKIHAVQTGTVRVHERQRTGKGRGVARFVRTLLDRQWTEPLPIHAWVIEHPEGLIVVDTGETARASHPGYFPRWHPYYRLAVREDVQEHEEIGPGMRALGLSPQDVRWVVLTHLHTDHAGRAPTLPGCRVPGLGDGVRRRAWPRRQAPRLPSASVAFMVPAHRARPAGTIGARGSGPPWDFPHRGGRCAACVHSGPYRRAPVRACGRGSSHLLSGR
jgi:glyoxylase-like metal-dependent hydrolase (beta-lactamase superfamily II)